jgi:mRNA-degrading endonuclease RelE of RelBE toxin-antitoxin system
VGDWRIVYTIEPPDLVLIVKIGHRKEVYER